jgi:hypothetical protein
MVALEPICMPTMCFWKNFKVLVFEECLKNFRRENYCTAYSVHVGDFYRILSTLGIFFTAYSVPVEYFLPHTQ